MAHAPSPRPGGLFLTFEGLDGSGKSTHLQAVAAALAHRRVPHVTTHEPGGTPLADAVRRVFLDPRWGEVDGGVELLLVFASRRHHLLERIEPALEQGAVVLCDRFTDSTYAYQGHGRGLDLELIDRVDELATGRRRPHRTLLFDLPAEEARRRGHSPSRRGRGAADRLDSEDVAFYERVRRGFRARAEAEPERFRHVDSSGSREETARQVDAALADLLGDLGLGRRHGGEAAPEAASGTAAGEGAGEGAGEIDEAGGAGTGGRP